MADDGAVFGGEPLQDRQGDVGVQLSAVGHVQHLLVEPDAPPALGRFRRGQEFSPQPGGKQRGLHLAQPGIRAVIYDAGAGEEPLPAVGFKLVPKRHALRQHRHIVGVGVGQVEVPRGTVGRAVAVPGPKLFQQGHIAAAPGQRPRRG